jgi:hypothetical protein
LGEQPTHARIAAALGLDPATVRNQWHKLRARASSPSAPRAHRARSRRRSARSPPALASDDRRCAARTQREGSRTTARALTTCRASHKNDTRPRT